MKIRTGFVSNSSSSSFIVAVPKGPKDEYLGTGDVSKLLGHDDFAWVEDCNKMKARDIWQCVESFLVYQELQHRIDLESSWKYEDAETRRANVEEYEHDFPTYFGELTYDTVVTDPAFMPNGVEPTPDDTEAYTTWDKNIAAEMQRRGQILWKKFRAEHPNHWIIYLCFADDSVVGSHMEHGDVFHALPHVRFSHH
ncbi:MAG: hypothetical protein WC505_05730 [Patescibacteria group bacterium]